MIEAKNKISYNKRIEESLKRDFATANTDSNFKRLIKTVDVPDKVAMKYTSQLEDTVGELKNCSKCDNLLSCQNKIEGHVFYPHLKNDKLVFTYVPCKYQLAATKKAAKSGVNYLTTANMAEIDITDKKRIKVIKWLKTFYDQFGTSQNNKGLYLHGNFGCGKTYLIAALFNELVKKRITTEIIYFPELLREIKGDFDSYADKIDYLQAVDLLLIDDLGAEKVTEWGRDEILGTILQSRMNNNKTTFFTSNLTIDDLEEHLVINNSSEDKVKARRIIERIKQLTVDLEMISENRRK